MGFLQKLGSIFSCGSTAPTSRIRWYYLECGKCGKKFKIGVNMSSELAKTYGEGTSGAAYTLRKVAQDDHCFTPIEIHIDYDSAHREIDRRINGGKFITDRQGLLPN